MEKYNIKYIVKHLNYKKLAEETFAKVKKGIKSAAIPTAISTALFAGGTITLMALSGCSESKNDNKTVIEQEAPDNASETPTDAKKPEVEVEKASMIEQTPAKEDIVNKSSEEYDKIDDLEEDIVDFAEENLPNGFVEVNEDNKLDMAEMFTDGYVMMNLSTRDSEITKSTVRVLNQKGNLSARAIIDNYQKFNYQIGDYMQIVTPDTKINFENLVIQADDAKFLNNLEEEIAQMNVATTAEERQTRINNIIAIRDSIITDYVTTSYSASTYYTAINMIIKADATAKAYGNKIFADEEVKVQLFTTLEKVCEKDYAGEYTTVDFELDVESIGASQTSAESRYLNEVANFLKEAVESKPDQQYDEYYAYGQVTERIAERILGLYKAPAMNAVEKENSIREAASKANTPEVGTTTTQTDVSPSEVPQEVRDKDTTTTTDYSDNQTTDDADYTKDASESNDVYIQAKGAGITDGSAAAANAYSTNYAGNAEAMPTKSVGAAPSEGCTNYNDVYNYFYAISWNEFRSSAISAEATARKENEEATTSFEPVDNADEEMIDETTETIVESKNIEEETNSTTNTSSTETKTTETKTTETETTETKSTSTSSSASTSAKTISTDTDLSTLDNGTYFMPVDATEEVIDEKIEEETVTETKETIEEETIEEETIEEETIEEETIETQNYSSAISQKIAALKALRNQVISMAYNIDINENVSVKRV